MGDLRVIEYPEEPCEIFALDVLEGVGIVVRNTALLAVVVVRGAELLTEKERLALKKVAVDAVEVVFDLRGQLAPSWESDEHVGTNQNGHVTPTQIEILVVDDARDPMRRVGSDHDGLCQGEKGGRWRERGLGL